MIYETQSLGGPTSRKIKLRRDESSSRYQNDDWQYKIQPSSQVTAYDAKMRVGSTLKDCDTC